MEFHKIVITAARHHDYRHRHRCCRHQVNRQSSSPEH